MVTPLSAPILPPGRVVSIADHRPPTGHPNRGNRTSAGWVLQARIVPAVPYYHARPWRGTLIRSVPLPDGLAPGASIEVALDDLPLPPEGGD